MNLLPALLEREAAGRDLGTRRPRWYLGIDLGTTNSTAALVDAQALQRGDTAWVIRLVPVRQETDYGPETTPLLASCVAEVQPGIWRVGLGAKQALRRGLARGRRIFYSTKSEMGLGREPYYPFAASRELDCPYKVAGRVLATLRDAVAEQIGEDALRNLIVTVPASFQLAARKDTMRAAGLAGLHLTEGSLFDEPNAALLDYLFTVAGQGGAEDRFDFDEPRVVLVFDFGGGTCDISIVRAELDPAEGRLSLANLAISRYEQLGGDNIDMAIAEQLLLPVFLDQNHLDPLDLTFNDKRLFVLPTLAGIAEALKLGVCAEYATQLTLHPREAIRRKQIAATQPSAEVEAPVLRKGGGVEKRKCVLTNPALTLDQLDSILQPFLDADRLFAQGTTFNTVTSIFAPVVDALDRAGIAPDGLDAVLLAGGSSLIPQVQHALHGYLPRARLLRFPSPDHTQFAIARGAALQSLFVHGLGKSLLRPIAQESIGVLTQGEAFVPLIPAGTELTFPAGGSTFARYDRLEVPHSGMGELHVVLAADSAAKLLGVQKMRFPSPPQAGDHVSVEWRLDANKVLSVRAFLSARPDVRCEMALENPLCSTGFQGEEHRRILELEQAVATATAKKLPPAQTFSARHELGWLYLGLGRAERALDWARSALQAAGRPDSGALHLMARAYERLGRLDRAEQRYREAVEADPDNASALFSLSVCLGRQDRSDKALEALEKALILEPQEGAYVAHRAELLNKLGRAVEAQQCLRKAADLLMQSGLPHEYQCSWLGSVANQLGDDTLRKAVRDAQERNRRSSTGHDPAKLPREHGDLPVPR